MERRWRAVRRVHTFCREELVYAALLPSLLAIALLEARVAYTGLPTLRWLHVNLALAWAPLLASLACAAVARSGRARAALVPLGLVWLVFFPNAPYLVSDLVHLRARAGVPLWFDATLLGWFAGAGILLAVASLAQMHAVWRRAVGAVPAVATVLLVVAASGLGIVIGRELRWNSWDLLLHPRTLAADVLLHLTHPHHLPEALAMATVYGAMLLVGYGALLAVRPRLR